MKYIIVYDDCHFFADSEEEVMVGLEEEGWELEDCSIYERGEPIKFEIKLVRTNVPTRTSKEK